MALIAWASVQDLSTVFGFADLTMALLALVNLLALWALYPVAMRLMSQFEDQVKAGESPRFGVDQLPDQALDVESWPSQQAH